MWNARKQMVEWLLPFYENKNEYVDLFYAITNCHGWVRSDNKKVTVRLEPLQQPSRLAAQKQFCRKLRVRAKITSQNWRSDLVQVWLIRESKTTGIASYFEAFESEVSAKDGLTMRCENVKLFLREPLGPWKK